MNKLNKKGFTLVELLAVIVVLAIIMIVAVPAVIKTMNDAQRSTFKLYVERMLKEGQKAYQTDLMLGSDDNKDDYGYCYTLSDMELSEKSTYAGYVVVELGEDLETKLYVTLSDNNFSVRDFTYAKISADNVELAAPVSDKSTLICPTEEFTPIP